MSDQARGGSRASPVLAFAEKVQKKNQRLEMEPRLAGVARGSAWSPISLAQLKKQP